MPGKIQSVKAPAKIWKREAFAKWLEAKKLKTEIVEEAGWLHARQADPGDFERLVSRKAGKGLVFQIGFAGAASKEKPGDSAAWYDRDVFETIADFLKD